MVIDGTEGKLSRLCTSLLGAVGLDRWYLDILFVTDAFWPPCWSGRLGGGDLTASARCLTDLYRENFSEVGGETESVSGMLGVKGL